MCIILLPITDNEWMMLVYFFSYSFNGLSILFLKKYFYSEIMDLKGWIKYVTLDHKTSHKGQFFKIEIYTFLYIWKLNK